MASFGDTLTSGSDAAAARAQQDAQLSNPFAYFPVFTWRGLAVPYDQLSIEFKHDLGEHRRPDLDGARIEATGRGPRSISARCIFLNRGTSLAAKPYQQAWYPDVFLAFMTAMEDRSSGYLNHPVRGQLICKPVSAKSVMQSTQRDGEIVECAWVETLDDDSLADYPAESPTAALQTEATSLDNELAKLTPPLPTSVTGTASFSDMCRSVTAVADTAALIAYSGAGKVNEIGYRLGNVHAALMRLATTPVAAINSVERLRSALSDVQSRLLSSSKPTRFYQVPADSTLGAIAAFLKATPEDLLKLNPTLARSASVQRGALVRYYS